LGIFDVQPEVLIDRAAQELKKIEQLTPPDWAKFVKTGHGKERPPVDPDWWFI